MFSLALVRRVGALLLLGTLVGCGGTKEVPVGETVTGKLTIKGKAPGTFATLVFVSASDPSKTGGGSVDPTGMFSGQAPQGKVKVALKIGMGGGKGPGSGPQFPKGPPAGGGPPTPGAPGPDAGKPSGPPKMAGAVEPPANAGDPQKSGVEIEVPKGGAKDLTLDFK
jgi:hypothetical protein